LTTSPAYVTTSPAPSSVGTKACDGGAHLYTKHDVISLIAYKYARVEIYAPIHDPPRSVDRPEHVRQRPGDQNETRPEFHVELLVDRLAVYTPGPAVGVVPHVPGVDIGVQEVNERVDCEEATGAFVHQGHESVRVGEVAVLHGEVKKGFAAELWTERTRDLFTNRLVVEGSSGCEYK
jgi:hypothetical protein